MKGIVIALAALIALPAAAASAQSATAVYVEGGVEHRPAGGAARGLDFGDSLRSGDTVVTRNTGRAELELENRSSISIRPNTVFTLQEVESQGRRQTVLSTAVGAVSFKLNRFTGTAPAIRTNSFVAGVRGTEFTVYAGMDGSSLLVVSEGEVELEAEGERVRLTPNEAVEVRPGEAPGAKFRWLGREQDFSDWNRRRLDEFLKDPVRAIENVERQLETFRRELAVLVPAYNRITAAFETAHAELLRMVEVKETERAELYRQRVFFPLMEQRATFILNIRYHALSALSLRRFVVANMYMQVRSRTITDADDPVARRFMQVYDRIIAAHEADIVPNLVDADI